PRRRDRLFGPFHQPADADVAGALDDRVNMLADLLRLERPAEDLAVKTFRVVDVGCDQLVPGESAFAARSVARGGDDSDRRTLRVADQREPSDVRNVHRLGEATAPGLLRAFDGLFGVVDEDISRPRGRAGPGRGAETAVELPVHLDHLVVHVLGPERLQLPAEQVPVELRRRCGIRRSVVVPDETARSRLHGCAHSSPLLREPGSLGDYALGSDACRAEWYGHSIAARLRGPLAPLRCAPGWRSAPR